MTDRVCRLEIRNQYGSPTLYPANETAQRFAALIGTKTIPRRAAEIIESLGFAIECTYGSLAAAPDWRMAK